MDNIGNLIITRKSGTSFFLDVNKKDVQIEIVVLPHKNGQCRFSIKAPKDSVNIWRSELKNGEK